MRFVAVVSSLHAMLYMYVLFFTLDFIQNMASHQMRMSLLNSLSALPIISCNGRGGSAWTISEGVVAWKRFL